MKIKKYVCILTFISLVASSAAAQSGTALSKYKTGYDSQVMGDYFNAIENYREALEINPSYADAWYNLSLCTFYLGEYELAMEYVTNAEKFSKDYSALKNLKGMCSLALGKIDDAEKCFNDVLAKFPNDVESRFGLAEIALYRGSVTKAEKSYQDALKRDPKSRKALLSLALVCAEQGKNKEAETYINQALAYHSGEAEVHYLASYLAAKRGDISDAERRARSAVQINPAYDKAYELLSEILYSQKRYTEVIDISDYRIGRNRNLSDAWYLKGIAENNAGLKSRALTSFSTGLSINPQDEIMRLAMEQLIAETVKIEDSRRTEWAKYHTQKAAEYKRNFNGPAERFEYQQALVIDPLNIPARQSFADMLERDGLYELYLYQLNFIKDNETRGAKRTDRQIKNDDKVEALESLMQNNIAHKWNVEPFYLNKNRWNIGIYYIKNPVQLFHADVERVLSQAASDIFSGVAETAVTVVSEPVTGYGDAYRLARSKSQDYFIVLKVDETGRSICLDADMYSGRTGTKTKSFHIYRTGNDKVASALQRFRSGVLDILPIRGTILKSASGQLLVDLGKSDGLVKNSVFDVVKKGKVYTKDSGPGITYKEEDIVGTFTVESLGEEICSGPYKKKGFYDMMNVGDEVVLISIPSEGQSQNGNLSQDSRPQANADGEPATASAEKTEKDKLKEDMKRQFTESSLLRMLRDII